MIILLTSCILLNFTTSLHRPIIRDKVQINSCIIFTLGWKGPLNWTGLIQTQHRCIIQWSGSTSEPHNCTPANSGRSLDVGVNNLFKAMKWFYFNGNRVSSLSPLIIFGFLFFVFFLLKNRTGTTAVNLLDLPPTRWGCPLRRHKSRGGNGSKGREFTQNSARQ